jgi:carbon storage regulator
MLILTRKPGESLWIGDNVKVTVVELKGHQIRIGIQAPKELRIYREEIYLQILEENKKAAEAGVSEAGLESLASAWAAKQGPKAADAGGSSGEEGDQKPVVSDLSAFTSPKHKPKDPLVVVKRKHKRDGE